MFLVSQGLLVQIFLRHSFVFDAWMFARVLLNALLLRSPHLRIYIPNSKTQTNLAAVEKSCFKCKLGFLNTSVVGCRFSTSTKAQ